jgi:hypothetical protein
MSPEGLIVHNCQSSSSYTSERQMNQEELDVSKLEAHIVEQNNGCMVLFGMSEGKRSLGRSGCRWEENTKFVVQAVRWEIVD